MGVEIERKFLVDGSRLVLPARGTEIRQGYLARSADRSVRVRLSRPTGDGDGRRASATLTIKGPDGLARAEFEYPLPPEDAEAILDTLCLPGEVHKVRHLVPVGSKVFEVDVYSGRHAGLITAEVELDSLDEPVTLPDWVTEEVTGDPAWTNAALSDPNR